jgi:replicative DNA helicase
MDDRKIFAINEAKAKIKQLEDSIEALTQSKVKFEPVTALKTKVDARPKHIPYQTGLREFDALFGGFRIGTFNLIAGSQFSGKSQFTLKVLSELARYNPVAFFNLEMYDGLLIEKLQGLTPKQMDNMLINSNDNTIEAIESNIKQLAIQGVIFFGIDSLMKIKNGNLIGNEKYSDISSRLSRLSQQLGIIIILIAQQSKADLKDGFQSIKGSGDLEYDADTVFFIDRDLNPKTRDQNRGVRKLTCTKDRYGGKEFTWQYTYDQVRIGINYQIHEFKGEDNE